MEQDQERRSMAIQNMLNPSDEEVRPSGNLSRAPVSHQSKKSPRSSTHTRRSSTSQSGSPEIVQKTQAFRPAYSTEEQHFIWYLRIDRGYLWPKVLDAFNARFSHNSGRRKLSGLQCRYYRLLNQHGIPKVRMLRTADVEQKYGMRASLARAGNSVTYPWLSGQYPNNAYGQVLDDKTTAHSFNCSTVRPKARGSLVYSQWNDQQPAENASKVHEVGKPSNVCEAEFLASRAHSITNKCPQCDRTFQRPADLKRHRYSHTQGGFPCPAREDCRAFTRRDHLTRHLKAVHGWVFEDALKELGLEDAEQVHAEKQVHEGGHIFFEQNPNLHPAAAAPSKRPRPKD